MKSHILAATVSALLCLWSPVPAWALDGQPYTHDPSTVVLCDGKYYAFGTGGGGLVSDDGWTWHAAPGFPESARPPTSSTSGIVTIWPMLLPAAVWAEGMPAPST